MNTVDQIFKYTVVGFVCIMALYGTVHLFVWFWVPVIKRCFS